MRMKKQIAVILGILLLATCLLAGCSSQEAPTPSADGTTEAKASESAAAVQSADGEKSGKPVLGVSLFYRRDEYYKDLDASFVKEAADAGLDIIIQDADSDASKQTQQLEDFVQQGVDAIALAPCDPAGLVPAIEAAVDAGIPVSYTHLMIASRKTIKIMVSTSIKVRLIMPLFVCVASETGKILR